MAAEKHSIPFKIQRRGYSARANEILNPEHHNRVVFIYAIRCGEFVKVGIAADVEARLRGMQCDNPYQLKIVAAVRCFAYMASDAEHAAHKRLARYHHRREWFICPDNRARDAVMAAPFVAAGRVPQHQVQPSKPLANFDTKFKGQAKLPFDFKAVG